MKCCRKIEINFITERKEIRLISSRNQRKRSKLEGTKERGQNWTYLVCGLRASAQNRRTRTPDCEGLKTLVAGDRWGAGRWRWSFKLSEFRVAAIEE
ncbi:hypothetical protein LXL04_033853 [Taraxacum kok-saghyz]